MFYIRQVGTLHLNLLRPKNTREISWFNFLHMSVDTEETILKRIIDKVIQKFILPEPVF